MKEPLVIDAGVAGHLVFNEAQREAAARWFAAARDEERQLVAPDFWLLECGNACRKRVARGWFTPNAAAVAYRQFKKLPVIRMATDNLVDHAANLALAFNITTYDALYAATAQYVGGTLVTADARLADALHATELAHLVSHVADLPG